MKKRVISCALALLLALSCAVPAGASSLSSSYDETYYATLDYYGALQDSSVVKSYRLNGQSSVTDYGSYDEVVNLTDQTQPVVEGGKVVFTPQAGSGDKFYFEAKTAKPYEELPWTISLSYKLNGAPILAQDLAGKTGLVEIALDIVPNAKAGTYAKSNLVLTAATAFNDDDITSLEAPGAEVQLIGNLRTVLFAVLPGEEQHFAIRVGSDSFESAGVIFLAVPATLQQLDKVAQLREVKEETQDSLDAMDASLDIILDTLEGMSGSLNTAAGGLDRLNSARGTISSRKEDIYAAGDGLHDLDSARATVSAGADALSQSADQALESLGTLSTALAALDRYGVVSAQAVEDVNVVLNDLNAVLQDLGPHLETIRQTVGKLQEDSKRLSGLLTELEKDNQRWVEVASDLEWNLEYLQDAVEDMQTDLERLERALRLTTGLKPLTTQDLLGLLSAQEQAQMKEVLSLHKQYEDYLKANGQSESQLSFESFIIAGAYRQFCQQTVTAQVEALAPDQVQAAVAAQSQALGRELTAEEVAAIQAQVVEALTQAVTAQLPSLEAFTQAPEAQSYIQQAQAAATAYEQFSAKEGMLETVNKKLAEVNSVLTSITGPTGQVVGDLADICQEATNTGLTQDLSDVGEMCHDLLEALKDHEGDGAALLEHADEVGDIVREVSRIGDGLLNQTGRLTSLVNTYHPEVLAAIGDVTTLSASLQTTLNDTAAALASAKALLDAARPGLDTGTEKTLNGLSTAIDAMRAADGDLDGGTRATLSGVAAALRSSTTGLAQTSTIREAKTTIHDLVTDQWDQHSGQVDALLNIDAGAIPVSMTSAQNPAPQNIQYIMRTQPIQVEEEGEDVPAAQKTKDERSVWQRVVDMFVDLWNGLIGLFKKK